MSKEDNIFEGVESEELQTPSNTDTSVKDVVEIAHPSMFSEEWHDYVTSLFYPAEMKDGHPLVAGLRRVAELVIGKIVFSGPTQVFPVQRDDHHGRATVIFTVTFSNGSTYSEVADSWEGNTDDAFCAYATCIASTRAEARALRKALKIRGVAAEELTTKDTATIVRTLSNQKTSTDGDYNDQNRMSDAQYNFIDVKCKQLNVDGKQLFRRHNVDAVKKVSKKVASEIIEYLNEFQRDKQSIPKELQGYKEGWRDA